MTTKEFKSRFKKVDRILQVFIFRILSVIVLVIAAWGFVHISRAGALGKVMQSLALALPL